MFTILFAKSINLIPQPLQSQGW